MLEDLLYIKRNFYWKLAMARLNKFIAIRHLSLGDRKKIIYLYYWLAGRQEKTIHMVKTMGRSGKIRKHLGNAGHTITKQDCEEILEILNKYTIDYLYDYKDSRYQEVTDMCKGATFIYITKEEDYYLSLLEEEGLICPIDQDPKEFCELIGLERSLNDYR